MRPRAWAASVGLCTLSRDTVAHMPCNPAVGGTAKGHLVREIDALGGLMGQAIDATGIQFKLLNRSRGPAVWSPRAQADKRRYSAWVTRRARARAEHHLALRPGRPHPRSSTAASSAWRWRTAIATRARRSSSRPARSSTASFTSAPSSGPPGGTASRRRASWPSRFEVVRLRDGPAEDRHAAAAASRQHRLRRARRARACSSRSAATPIPVAVLVRDDARRCETRSSCWLLHTNERVRELVREHIDQSPLYNGQIQGIGPRYCPSLEDKIMRFPDRERHQIYLEPEGLDVDEIYVNGFSMSLPRDVQEQLVHALPGLEDARDAAARLRGRVRLRPADRAEVDARDAARRGLVLRRADQRHVRLRGSGGAGARGRHQRRARGSRRAARSRSDATRRTSAFSSTTSSRAAASSRTGCSPRAPSIGCCCASTTRTCG